MLDPRRLLTFREVARHGSFSRAAESLSLTQSAVSQQVANLEREQGVRLLDRGHGGLRLTPPGERLLGHADAIAERLRLADVQLDEMVTREGRELRIGAFPSALATLVPAAVVRLAADEPGVDVVVHEGRLGDLEAPVREGRLHMALGFQAADAPRHDPAPLRRHDLLDEPMVALLPPRHRLARRATVALSDLAGDPWTAPSRDGIVVRACRSAGFEPRITMLTSDPLAIRAVVQAGLAVTLSPRMLARQLTGVHVATLARDAPRRSIYALLPPSGARALDQTMLAHLTDAAG